MIAGAACGNAAASTESGLSNRLALNSKTAETLGKLEPRFMNLPAELKYTASHEWVRVEDGVLVVGITDPAQDMLGDLVFVGDVTVGARLEAGATAGVVESVKAASDIHAPVAGEIVAFNQELGDTPDMLNADPYQAWIFKLRPDDLSSVSALMDADAYRAIVDAA